MKKPFNHSSPIFVFLCVFVSSFSPVQGIDAINQSKVVELLKDGGAGGGDRRHSREGINGPGGQRGESEGDDSAEWNGVSLWIQIHFSTSDRIKLIM